jgi:hypothetical protein
MIYGGSIQPGKSRLTGGDLSISSCFESAGALMYGKITEEQMDDIVRHACPGPGGCGGMYTANTMASAIEVMGLTLPGSSSFPAGSPAKFRECENAAEAIRVCLEKDIKPRDLVTKESLENALVLTAALGGSTNSVLHFLAISHSADLDLSLDDFKRVADKTPILANIKPFGKYMMNDLYEIGKLSEHSPHRFRLTVCRWSSISMQVPHRSRSPQRLPSHRHRQDSRTKCCQCTSPLPYTRHHPSPREPHPTKGADPCTLRLSRTRWSGRQDHWTRRRELYRKGESV